MMNFLKPCYRTLVACAALAIVANAEAQSDQWDSLLTGSAWFVPAENLLAYATSGSSLANPQAVADQTLWNITSSLNGVFTGTSVTTFKIGPITSSSTATMNGIITDGGQIRIAFTQEGGPTTVGIGQVQNVDGKTLLQMQMISGDPNSVYITHWAYMAAYDGDPSSLPSPEIESSLRSEEWNWMLGTDWNFASPELFGAGEMGSFHIEGYRNGYFWGTGSGPDGSNAEAFTLLGSATPEGNILFNILSGETLTSLTGQITGDASDGMMGLRSYTPEDFGDLGYAHIIPEPSATLLFGLAAAAVYGAWRRRRKQLS